MNVVSINPKEDREEKLKSDMLEVLDHLRNAIEAGEVVEFAAVSMGPEGDAQIHVCTMDFVGGVGLFEVGKHILISQQN